MRKLAAGLLAIGLVFAVAACGDDSGSSSSGTGGSGTTGGGGSGNFGDCDITVAKGSLGDVGSWIVIGVIDAAFAAALFVPYLWELARAS